MTWLNSLLKTKTKTIQVKILNNTDKSIQVQYGLTTTYLPKNQIKVKKSNDEMTEVVVPLWLFQKKFGS
jgi:hypothetical protein